MRKLFFFATLLATFASCTKNDLAPMNEGEKEITYLTAPLTKTTSYGTTNKFYSFAYLVTGSGSSWALNSASSSTFIDHALISYNSNQWKADEADKHYYWPRDQYSSLTFFAWGDGTSTPDNSIGDCLNTTGVTFSAYDITNVMNRDLMVAKIAADQKANTTSGADFGKDGVTKGVPTLFYHVLSSLAFQAKTDKAYTDYTFKVKSITFNDVCVKGAYAQGVDTQYLPTGAPVSGTGSRNDVWTEDVATKDNLVVFSSTDVAGTQVNVDGTTTTLNAKNTDYKIMLPHTLLDSEKVKIVYTVFNGSALEEVTKIVELNDIFTEGWLPGKKYTLTITLSLEEILWDPAVENWDATGSGDWDL